jgi:isopentenyl diphosphate isomerase/L-lactate dehydrogenase-like FMN-dependent dehydrogenase
VYHWQIVRLKEHVKKQLPSLVKKAVTAGLEDLRLTLEGEIPEEMDSDYENMVERPLQWLLRAAGAAAVNTAAVAAALLNVLPLIPETRDLQRHICDAAIESGFQLHM